MELVTFNPTLATTSYEDSDTVTPPPILREGWTVGGYSVGLNQPNGTGYVTAAFLAPPGVRALTVSFRAEYMPEAESNWAPMRPIDPRIQVSVGRINSSQSFMMFDSYADYNPDPPSARDVQLDIDVSKITARINGVDTLEVVPVVPIDVDDYVTIVSVTCPVGDHIYSAVFPYVVTATLFGISNFVISPLGVPAFWTSFVGTREAL